MFLDYNLLTKVLFAGFQNGIKIGRYLKYDKRSAKHFHRVQHNSKKQSYITNERIRSISGIEEQYIPMEQNNIN